MDEVEVKLPVSGKTVVIRNYTTRKDDARSEAVLYAGVTARQDSLKKGQNIEFSMAALKASQEVYVERLVMSVDGKSDNLSEQIENLRSEDYEVLEEAVNKVVEEHSPKAKKAKENSKADTKES